MNLLPSKKLAGVFAAVFAVMLGVPQDAGALAIGDGHELGAVYPATPNNGPAITQYVNFMIGLSLGGSGHVVINGKDNLVTRSTNDFGPLGTASVALQGIGTIINLGAQGTYSYLFAKYGGAGSEVWYVGNLSGLITIPANWGPGLLTSWALLCSPNGGVPDTGTTVALLAAALCALAVVRRYLLVS
jgi:VPDSG-CTERM motif